MTSARQTARLRSGAVRLRLARQFGNIRTLAAMLLCLCCAATHALAATDWNVRAFGAKGDGVTDDTAAFQKAIDARSAAEGGVVRVPAGKYLIKTHIAVRESVALVGEWRAPATVDSYHTTKDQNSAPLLRGSVLLAVEGAGQENGTPFIELNVNSTIEGLTIFYPEQKKTNPPVAYPWTVRSNGAINCAIIDVLMVNPYQAVDFGSTVAWRHLIRGLYAQPLRRGLYIDRCYDIGRIEDIHFWPFWTAGDVDSPLTKYMLEQGEAFICGRSDWEYATNCVSVGYGIGWHFVRSADNGVNGGGGNYLLTQSGADLARTAVLVDETQAHAGISFANSQLFGDIAIKPTNQGMVRFTGCGFFGSIDGARGTALAKIAGTGRVSFGNCSFYCIDPASRRSNTVFQVDQGRISIEGCVFLNSRNTTFINGNPIPIVLMPDVRSATIVGNEFYGKVRLDNKSRGRVVFSDNVEETDEDPFPVRAARRKTGIPVSKRTGR